MDRPAPVGLPSALLRHGAHIDAREWAEGHRALGRAAHRDHGAVVDLLLRRGADPTVRDLQARTAADHARAAGHDAVLAHIAGRCGAGLMRTPGARGSRNRRVRGGWP